MADKVESMLLIPIGINLSWEQKLFLGIIVIMASVLVLSFMCLKLVLHICKYSVRKGIVIAVEIIKEEEISYYCLRKIKSYARIPFRSKKNKGIWIVKVVFATTVIIIKMILAIYGKYIPKLLKYLWEKFNQSPEPDIRKKNSGL